MHELPDNWVRLDFKWPWSDGTTSVTLDAVAFIARLAAIVPPPKRHVVRYYGVLSSHSKLRSQIVPPPGAAAGVPEVPLRLIALVKSEATIKKILGAMGLPTESPQAARARPPPQEPWGVNGGETWDN